MIDADGLDELIVDLTRAGLTAGLRAMNVLDHVGEQVRDLSRSLAPRTGLQHYAQTITHEVSVDKTAVTVEVGPEKGGQGSLGHILEKGTADTPPHAHLGPALDAKSPQAVKRLADVLGKL